MRPLSPDLASESQALRSRFRQAARWDRRACAEGGGRRSASRALPGDRARTSFPESGASPPGRSAPTGRLDTRGAAAVPTFPPPEPQRRRPGRRVRERRGLGRGAPTRRPWEGEAEIFGRSSGPLGSASLIHSNFRKNAVKKWVAVGEGAGAAAGGLESPRAGGAGSSEDPEEGRNGWA